MGLIAPFAPTKRDFCSTQVEAVLGVNDYKSLKGEKDEADTWFRRPVPGQRSGQLSLAWMK